MAELIFYHGPVSVGKTLGLLLQVHQIKKIHGDGVIKVLKPVFDTRSGYNLIRSSSGLQCEVDYCVDADDDFYDLDIPTNCYLFVDEVQFLSVKQIVSLRKISLEKNIYIECYGLLKNFKNELFESSTKLLELCDNNILLPTFCYFCNRNKLVVKRKNATCSMRINSLNGEIIPTLDGKVFQVGGIDKYLPVCSKCFHTTFNLVEKTDIILSLTPKNDY